MIKKIFFSFFIAFISTSAFAQNILADEKICITNLNCVLSVQAQQKVQEEINKTLIDKELYSQYRHRAALYFPSIEKIFAQKKISTDFKYLALLETGLLLNTKNKPENAGIWQISEENALKNKLIVNDSIDERLNLVLATQTAINLQKFSEPIFVSQKDSNLVCLDQNLSSFQSKFLAYSLIFKQNQSIDYLELIPYFAKKGEQLDQIAIFFDLDLENLLRYNAFIKKTSLFFPKDYTIFLPTFPSQRNQILDKILLANSDISFDKNQVKDSFHVVQPDENLEIIAKKYDLNIKDLIKWNNLDKDGIVVEEQKIWIKITKKANKIQTEQTYLTKNGDDIYTIAEQFGVKISDLKLWNDLPANVDIFKDGIKLIIKK